LKSPNNGADEYVHNNSYTTDFQMPPLTIDEVYIWFWTNNAAFESKYQLLDSEGNVLFSRSGMSNNTEYRDTFDLSGGCYTFLITDTGDDGIDFWANNDGVGFCRLVEVEGDIIDYVEGDFGGHYQFNFSVDPTVGIKENPVSSSIRLFPNPSSEIIHIEGSGLENKPFVYNELGELVPIEFEETDLGYKGNIERLPAGIYYVQLVKNGAKTGRKFVVIR
jgi:hypothetical protein